MAGHQGMERTLKLIRMRCYWPTLTKDVTNYIQNCIRCKVAKEPTPKSATLAGPTKDKKLYVRFFFVNGFRNWVYQNACTVIKDDRLKTT